MRGPSVLNAMMAVSRVELEEEDEGPMVVLELQGLMMCWQPGDDCAAVRVLRTRCGVPATCVS